MNKLTRIVSFAVVSALAAASAQVVEKKSLTLDGAKKVIAGAIAFAKVNRTTGVVAVVDEGGHLIALERVDNTFAAGANISIGKARTAVLFKRPTRFFEELINASGKGRSAMTAMPEIVGFTPLIGGVPIMVDGQIVGGVGVSGAASAAQDEEMANAGANALSANTLAAISYFEKAKVDAAFAQGAVLLDGDSRNYMVHASRREKAGQAEVHSSDTDVIHVLSGTATFVTGGKVVGGKNIAEDEVRGASIDGGESRQIAQGDVIVVPKGVPHWFKEVKGPMTYYVVKVR
jgi:uncharacterized protein GlcG (DUF336 family)